MAQSSVTPAGGFGKVDADLESLPAELQAELSAMRRAYRQMLPDKADHLERLSGKLAQGGAEARSEVMFAVHQLAGTAGAYGQAALSDRAALAELRLGDGAEITHLLPLLAQLCQMMRAAAE